MYETEDAVKPVTGWSGDATYFNPREYDRFVPEAALDVLSGRAALVIFRNVVPADVCSVLARRFWDSPHRKVRGGDVPGYYIGSYAWDKTTAQYLDESEVANPHLEALLDVPGDPLKQFYAGLSDALAAEGSVVRIAQHEGRKSSVAVLRSWTGVGDFALAPHEDDSQCSDPQMAGFEREGVVGHTVAALNICLENHEGGRLVYWNIRPDAESKNRLGVNFLGLPYPVEALKEFSVNYVTINTGDIYLFNGAHIHAVEPNTDGTQRRTTILAMMGFIDEHTVVTWT